MAFNSGGCTPDVVAVLSVKHRRWLQSAFLACVAYGIVLTLACMCSYLILYDVYARFRGLNPGSGSSEGANFVRRVRRAVTRRMGVLLVYVLGMTALSTVTVVSWMDVADKVLVRTGCWDGVTTARTPVVLDKVGNFAWVFANWGADGILVWRCWVIYSRCSRFPVWAALALPIALYLSVIGLGIVFMVPGGRGMTSQRVLEMVYSSLTLVLNIIVTGMISIRLLVYRWKITRTIGKSEGVQYASVVAMLVESAALVVVFNAFFVATIGRGSLVSYIAFAGNVQSQTLAPLLIIFRVLQGKAWTGPETPPERSVSPRFASAASSVFDQPPREGYSMKGFSAMEAQLRVDLAGDRTNCKPEGVEHERGSVDVSLELKRLSRNIPFA
ncbi:hypothetical protein DFP72DRAFT_217776 [Ephemerocybe angulata]|uniref:Uncharacterized protein n=1 Tax=Ephemerocybe angulata TaxID=980116 RepID=A0A8H6H9Y4_9AGAR|nr:hypothetical protein DFP72DRAFT_217776 [Tulosesus angulatus]